MAIEGYRSPPTDHRKTADFQVFFNASSPRSGSVGIGHHLAKPSHFGFNGGFPISVQDCPTDRERKRSISWRSASNPGTTSPSLKCCDGSRNCAKRKG